MELIGLRAVVNKADRAAWRGAVIVGETDRSAASKQHKRGASGAGLGPSVVPIAPAINMNYKQILKRAMRLLHA